MIDTKLIRSIADPLKDYALIEACNEIDDLRSKLDSITDAEQAISVALPSDTAVCYLLPNGKSCTHTLSDSRFRAVVREILGLKAPNDWPDRR